MFRVVDDVSMFAFISAHLSRAHRSQLRAKVGKHFDFSSKNPTGHYDLDMSDENDRLVSALRACVPVPVEGKCGQLHPNMQPHNNTACLSPPALKQAPTLIMTSHGMGVMGMCGLMV